jgi:hypothetical protein
MTRRPLAGLALLCLCMAFRACVTTPVEAQADDALVLARVVWHEAGFSAPDVPGVYSVLYRGAARRGISFAAMARAYSPRAHAGTTSRTWAMALTADCSRPRGYPLPWTAARHDACVALIEAARVAVSAGPVCECDQWASRDDFRRAVAAGRRFRMVDCGPGARNLFAVEVYR